ncbi:MAG TPA: NADPH-dependent F420 reductase [Chthoniobacterales bacterium]
MNPSSIHIGILGSGNIGKNAAKHFVRVGHRVRLSNSKGPETLTATVAEIGPEAEAATTADTVAFGEVILLAVPWAKRAAAFAAAGGPAAFAGKIVIDALNPYTEFPSVEELHGRTSSSVVASELPDARVVKAFNTIYFETLANGSKRADAPDRIALPVCGDDPAAKRIVCALIEQIGFDAVDAGTLAQSRRQEPFQPLYNKDYPATQVLQELAKP